MKITGLKGDQKLTYSRDIVCIQCGIYKCFNWKFNSVFNNTIEFLNYIHNMNGASNHLVLHVFNKRIWLENDNTTLLA